jgi:CRP-like cAMP-binding protein
MTMDVKAELTRLAFTANLDGAQVERLAEICRPVEWDANTTIFKEGDRDDALYLVVDGHVSLETTVPSRGRVRLMTVSPGEAFGWSSVFYQKPKTSSARTVEPTRALALDAVRLRALCDADPALGYLVARRLLEVVSDRLKAARMQLLDVFAR